MKLVTPYTGVVINAGEEQAKRLIARGYQPMAAKKTEGEADKPAKAPAKPKRKAK